MKESVLLFILSGVVLGGVLLFFNFMVEVYFKWGELLYWSGGIYFSSESSGFYIFITLIFLSVVLYSKYYMMESSLSHRFFLLTFLFYLSMCVLIFSSGVFVFFLGWDGLGISSFCLVCFFFNFKCQNSAMVTILSNRMGDVLLLLSMCLILSAMLDSFQKELSLFILFLILITSLTKSAQFPFSSWLPLAMAAPTPISALVHSSTLVTAGFYFILKFFMFMSSSMILMGLGVFSLFTLFLSGSASLMEVDMKKIVALSTLSQISLMFFTLSVGFKSLSFFHLLSHALFKSLLFLNVGVLLHLWFSSQDYRFFMKKESSPILSVLFIISWSGLLGLFFTIGFYSKESILSNMEGALFLSLSVSLLFTLSVFFTFFYTFQIFKMSSGGSFNTSPLSVSLPLMSVAPSMFIGGACFICGVLFITNFLYLNIFSNNFFKGMILSILILFLMLKFYKVSLVYFSSLFYLNFYKILMESWGGVSFFIKGMMEKGLMEGVLFLLKVYLKISPTKLKIMDGSIFSSILLLLFLL